MKTPQSVVQVATSQIVTAKVDGKTVTVLGETLPSSVKKAIAQVARNAYSTQYGISQQNQINETNGSQTPHTIVKSEVGSNSASKETQDGTTVGVSKDGPTVAHTDGENKTTGITVSGGTSVVSSIASTRAQAAALDQQVATSAANIGERFGGGNRRVLVEYRDENGQRHIGKAGAETIQQLVIAGANYARASANVNARHAQLQVKRP